MKMTELELEFICESADAIMVTDGDTEAWLPKSVIAYPEDAQRGDTIVVDMPVWLAEDRGLV